MSKNADNFLEINGAREHNLKNIHLKLPLDQLVVITGLSGSGKSSLAFDTIYAEGQRRYIESLSAYARQFLGVMNKPDVDSIHGLSPAISIEQKTVSKNPRSTVGTITEIYDYMRLLYARVGQPHCPNCGKPISAQTPEMIIESIMDFPKDSKVVILAPVIKGKKGTYEKLFDNLEKKGFSRVRVNGEIYEIGEQPRLEKNKKHTIDVVIDRVKITDDVRSRVAEAVEEALQIGEGFLTALKNDKEYLFSKFHACTECGISFEKLEPRSFSFNSPFGACEHCHGLGFNQEFDVDLIIPDKTLSLDQGAIAPWRGRFNSFRVQKLRAVAKQYGFSMKTPFEDLDSKFVDLLLYGSDTAVNFDLKFKKGTSYSYQGLFEGIIPQLERLLEQTDSESRRQKLRAFMREHTCTTCEGKRLKPESLSVMVGGKNIYEMGELAVIDALDFVGGIKLGKNSTDIAKPILKEIRERLSFLKNVGLDYLTLNRSAGTLSGGEGQRIRLATQIGSELRGVMYILDEPSIGLHQRDNNRLIEALKNLRDIGNTLIVVEHDADTIMAADYVVDIGPGAGVHGGEVVAEGTPKQVMNNKKSLTGKYLSGKYEIELPDTRRKAKNYLTLKGANENNLKNVDVKFPLEVLTCVTGVSGSGKSTLINETLYKALAQKLYKSKDLPGKYTSIDGLKHVDKVINVDQSPIGRTPRSNPATYIKVFDKIRELFSQTEEARARGYKVGRFSFNVEGGRCEHCSGDGTIKIEMHFLPDVYVECEKCNGKRYNQETLEVRYKDKSIADVLDMTVEEAWQFFKKIPAIEKKLETLNEVGLGYIRLGQSATTLSGGEAQRMKLTLELSKRDTGNTFYILDEPTTGLHFEDIKKLLNVLEKLVEKGNTVLVIEHNLDVIKVADYIIDLGPEGGAKGGTILYEGPTEGLVKVKKSYTGKYLKPLLT